MAKIHIHDSKGVAQELNLGGTLTATDVDTQNHTLTVAQLYGGLVVHTSVTGAGTFTMPTAAAIIAGSSEGGGLKEVGDSVICYYINDGSQTVTMAVGTDVTIADTGQTVAANESAILLFRKTAATTVTMYIIGA